jgi:hypothetical protein
LTHDAESKSRAEERCEVARPLWLPHRMATVAQLSAAMAPLLPPHLTARPSAPFGAMYIIFSVKVAAHSLELKRFQTRCVSERQQSSKKLLYVSETIQITILPFKHFNS